MEFKVLGELVVENAGHPVSITSQKQRSVLAVLLINRGTVVSVDRLIDDVWGPDAGIGRENALRVHISNLRSALEPDRARSSTGSVIVTRSLGYVIDLDSEHIDAGRFESELVAGRSLIETDPHRAREMLADALALWTGRAYEDFTYEPFAQNEVRRLHELRLEAVEARIDADLGCGRTREIVSELESLSREHPFREIFTSQLMTALHRSGRQADALRSYQLLRDRLVEELGIEPSPELRALELHILSEDDALAGPPTRPAAIATPATGLALRGYEIREEIATGPVGAVHRGFQPSVGREVAITIVGPEFADDPEFIRRFEADGRAVGALEHPHIVPLFDYWREPGRAVLVHQLMSGSLHDLVDRSALEPQEASVIVDRLASALDLAHRRGIVHGDVRANVILFDDERVAYLSGFGLGGPESADGATAAGDVSALAVVTGQSIAGMHGDIAQIGGALDPGLAEVLANATDPDPERRPTALELARQVSIAVGRDQPEALPPEGPVENPYRGLAPFGTADGDVFYGRERVIDRLVARIGDPSTRGRFVAVVGPSGAGKSSVVRAGVLPALASGIVSGSAGWFVATMTPGRHPFEALEAALLSVAVHPPPTLYEQLAAGENGLRRAVRRLLPDETSQLLLVIDQFEEVFTLANQATVDAFLDGLAGAVADGHSRVRIIVTLRADFYDRPLRHRSFGELLRTGTEVITPMTPEEIEAAITRPAGALGVNFTPAVVAQMVQEVAGRPGALPLLQYALTELFQHRAGALIGTETYRGIGGVSGALARRAESLLHKNSHGVEATRQILLRLVTLGDGTQDTRRRTLRAELDELDAPDRPTATRGVSNHIVDRFAAHRLFTLDRDPVTRGPTVEISHEALLTEWSTLRDWIANARDDVRDQRRLASARDEWIDAGRTDDQLLAGGRLDRLASWAATSDVTLSASEQSFLDRSIERRDHLQQRQVELESAHQHVAARARRFTRFSAIAGAVAAVVGVLAVVAVVQARSAQRSEDELAASLRSQELAAASTFQLRSDLPLAASLALEAAGTTSEFGVVTPDAVDAMHWVVQEANVVYPVDDSTNVAVRPGPNGPTGVYVLGLDVLSNLVGAVAENSFSAEQCTEFFAGASCPAVRPELPSDLEILGGAASYGSRPIGPGALAGTRVEITSSIAFDDAGFAAELAGFEDESGIVISSAAFRDPGYELERRPADLEALPDIVFWPQPAQLASFEPGGLIDLSNFLDVEKLGDDVGSRFMALVTVGDDGGWPATSGAVLGLPVDADIKGLVYYPRARFEQEGYEIPGSWDELVALSDQLVAEGRTPWCFHFESGGGSGWPGTDLIETLVVLEGGVDLYDAWASHEVPFDHPTVLSAAAKVEHLLLTEGYARGGSDAISRFGLFPEGLSPLMASEPECWFLHGADFLSQLLATEAELGVDVDAFAFPPIDEGQGLPALGGGSVLSALGDRPEVRQFIRHVASPRWGEAWAQPSSSSFISPNQRFDVENYGAAASDGVARFRQTVGTLARDSIASDSYRFDASDLMPPPIGSYADGDAGAFWTGMLDVVDGRRTMNEAMSDIEVAWIDLESGP